MRIGDRVVRNAVETIVNELEMMESRIQELQNEVSSLESTIEMQQAEIDALTNDLTALHEENKRLDDALADTYIAQLDPKATREEAN